jgi:hypothetical protein
VTLKPCSNRWGRRRGAGEEACIGGPTTTLPSNAAASKRPLAPTPVYSSHVHPDLLVLVVSLYPSQSSSTRTTVGRIPHARARAVARTPSGAHLLRKQAWLSINPTYTKAADIAVYIVSKRIPHRQLPLSNRSGGDSCCITGFFSPRRRGGLLPCSCTLGQATFRACCRANLFQVLQLIQASLQHFHAQHGLFATSRQQRAFPVHGCMTALAANHAAEESLPT